MLKVKGKRHNTYIAPQAATAAAVALLCQTELACPRPHDFESATKQPYAALVCRLMVSTPVIHVIT